MLSDLVFVLNHIKTIIESYSLFEIYVSIGTTLKQIAAADTPELQQALKDYKTRVKEAHAALEPVGWSFFQLQIFDNFGARGVLGDIGYQVFLNALTENSANIPGAIAELNTQSQAIKALHTNATSVLSSLGNLGKETPIKDDRELVEIVFDKDVAINNIPEWAKQGELWERIIRAYSLLADVPPESTIIIHANKSNPYELWTITIPLLAKAFRYTAEQFLAVWNEVLDCQMHILAVEEKRMLVAAKKYKLFNEIRENETRKVKEILEYVGNNFHKDKIDDGLLNQAKSELLRAGEDLYKFITGGGKVDVPQKENAKSPAGTLLFEPTYGKIHLLRDKVLLLLAERNKRPEPKVIEVSTPPKPKKAKKIKNPKATLPKEPAALEKK